MELQIQTTRIMTGFRCKYCDGSVCGHYAFIDGEMFVKCQCQFLFWLVKSTCLTQTFNYFRTV